MKAEVAARPSPSGATRRAVSWGVPVVVALAFVVMTVQAASADLAFADVVSEAHDPDV